MQLKTHRTLLKTPTMKQSAVLPSEHISQGSSGNTKYMDNQSDDSIQALAEQAKEYLETRVELIKLKAIDKSADVVSSIASRVVTAVALIVCCLILNIGLGLLLGELLGKSYYGFFVLAAIYLITGLLFKSNGTQS